MTQEDKELLFKDLCARLPYGVKVYNEPYTFDLDNFEFSSTISKTILEIIKEGWKPYLRPMSSMTEEEIKEYKHLIAFSGSPNGAANLVDWLNKKMFAYRTDDEGKTMTEKGIALKAPEGMYTDDKFVPITKEELEKTRINSKDYLI